MTFDITYQSKASFSVFLILVFYLRRIKRHEKNYKNNSKKLKRLRFVAGAKEIDLQFALKIFLRLI